MTDKLREAADKISTEAAQPTIRSMYPTRSRNQMANEFRHFFISGAEWAREEYEEKRQEMYARLMGQEHILGTRLEIAESQRDQLLEVVKKLVGALERIEEDSCDYDHDDIAGEALSETAEARKALGL